MPGRSINKKRILLGLAILAVAFFVASLPTPRIYLCGASTTHLKSGEWVISGPSIRMTDGRLRHLVNAINDRGDISCMRISAPAISDSGFAALSGLKTLDWLFVEDSNITDDGLLHFHQLTSLRKLYFDRCPNLSDSSITTLREALPNCTIYVDAYTF